MTWPRWTREPRSTARLARRPVTFRLSTTCSSALSVPFTDTVRTTLSSLADTTRTSRGLMAGGAPFCGEAVAVWSELQPDAARTTEAQGRQTERARAIGDIIRLRVRYNCTHRQ